ncbi:hypothetical protein KTE26_04770 [Ralstonia mannitolilytica]|uniref:Lipoprotein n=1 Tax=Ralstonia mannitolilytica TaxID=105219 RepID=A0AAJ4ZMZ0_9RALS|nr:MULTISPECIES: hypothetical protein [Ralstonia]MBU9577755.1 hypothetical protein [Ralstonia mannitolilytica]PLT20006.1 hypothetical protein CXP34_08780 [Ralstonia mannitolilytica]CAG2144021.1 hypothetical protein LMG6866_02602 [Ralstonia mannitolilytica]CAJ0724118.1 hypothetical protein R77592_00204 [Ralstonia mannitolilytica]SUD88695.1 Uncharacterised protein [Ralstonia mannitolilytica]
MAQPAARPRSLLSRAKPALAVAVGLCLLAACKSVPAIDPGKPPAMDPTSANTQPPASVSAAHPLGDIIVGLSTPTTASTTVQSVVDAAGARATPRLAFAVVRPMSGGFWVVRASSGDASATLDGAVAALRSAPGIASADADRVMKLQRQ